MRKVLLTVFSVAFMGASAMVSAFAQQAADPVLPPQVTELQTAAVAACAGSDTAACRLALQALADVMAQLVADGVIAPQVAQAVFQNVRTEVRVAGGNVVIDQVFEELFPETASVDESSPA
jgi:hypothetical protein